MTGIGDWMFRRRKKQIVKFIAGFLVLMHAAAPAEDIDLFAGSPAGASNVLLIIDNAANFSASAAKCTYPDGTAPSMNGTIGGVEQCALYAAINNLKVNPDGSAMMNIGMMAFNATGFVDWKGGKCDLGSAVGGCLMVPIMPMTASNKAEILAWIKTWEVKGGFAIKTNQAATGAVMQEAWAYFAGHRGLAGRSYADMEPGTWIALRIEVENVPEEVTVLTVIGRLWPAVFALAFGRVLIEAMAMERPSVATGGGGVPEIVVHDECGLLVPPGDPRALADALLALLRDPARAARLGRAARQRAETRFDIRRHAEAVEVMYARLVSARHGRV